MVQTAQNAVEVPQAHYTDRIATASVVMQRQVPSIQTAQTQRQVPVVQTVQRTAEAPQVQCSAKDHGYPCATDSVGADC